MRTAASECCPACGDSGCHFGLPIDQDGVVRLQTPTAGQVDGECPNCSLALEWESVFDQSRVLNDVADQRDWLTARTQWVMNVGRTPSVCQQLKQIGRFPEFAGDVDLGIPLVIRSVALGATVPNDPTGVLEHSDHDGWTMMHWAAAIGSAEVVERLVRLGATVDARNARGETPLMLASALTAGPEIVEALLRAGADVRATTTSGYDDQRRYDECGRAIRAHAGRSALHFAAESGGVASMDALLGAGADANLADENGTTAVMLASTADAVRSLVAAGANVRAADAQTRQAVHHAALRGDAESLEQLIKCGADPHAATSARTGATVLTCAIAKRNGKNCVHIIEQLVRAGVSVNEPAADRMQPLEFAVRQNDAGIVERLLALGAEVDAQGYRGTFALHSSLSQCGGDRTEITLLLLQSGADVNRPDFAHNTPLILACEHRLSVNRLRMLIGAGAKVNAVGRRGMTALHHACAVHRPDLVAALLSAGADSSIVDAKGRTARDLAKADAVKVLFEG